MLAVISLGFRPRCHQLIAACLFAELFSAPHSKGKKCISKGGHGSGCEDDLLQVNAGIAKLTVGMPEDDAAIVPVVSKSSADFIEGLVKDAEAKGATLCQEYKREGNLIWPLLIDKVSPATITARFSAASPGAIYLTAIHTRCSGYLLAFLATHIQPNHKFLQVTPEMRIAWEEPFGPVIPVVRVPTVEAAIDHCNTNNLALQVRPLPPRVLAFWQPDSSLLFRFSRPLAASVCTVLQLLHGVSRIWRPQHTHPVCLTCLLADFRISFRCDTPSKPD